jgi:hypothetical protein
MCGGEVMDLAGGKRRKRKTSALKGTKKVKCSRKSSGKKCILKKVCKVKNGKRVCKNKKLKRVIGTKLQVWRGTALKTRGGLKKSDLMKNKAGKIVSRKKSSRGKSRKSTSRILQMWRKAVKAAAKALGVKKGFVKPKKGTKLYSVAKKLFARLKAKAGIKSHARRSRRSTRR